MSPRSKRTTPRGATMASLPQLGQKSGPAGAHDVADLSARVRFNPADGQVWLDDQRMLLIHLSSMTSLRKELVDSLGIEVARGLLTRMGYTSGARDAEIARRIRPDQSWHQAFLVGPQLHALEGIVSVEPVRLEADAATGHFYGEFIWRNSAEVDWPRPGLRPGRRAGVLDADWLRVRLHERLHGPADPLPRGRVPRRGPPSMPDRRAARRGVEGHDGGRDDLPACRRLQSARRGRTWAPGRGRRVVGLHLRRPPRRARGADRRHRAVPRRDRRRQGGVCAHGARGQPAPRPAVRRRQLRRDPGDADRGRAVRRRARRLHRGRPARAPDGSSGHTAAPCSSTRSARSA